MKTLNLLKKSAIVSLLTTASLAQATDVTVPLVFETVPEITVTNVKDIDFGNVLTLSQADECVMSTSAGGSLLVSDEGFDVDASATGAPDDGTTDPAGGELSSDCLGAADAQPGVYEISSSPGATISVTVAAGAATEILFEPAGYITDFANNPGTAAQIRNAFVDGVADTGIVASGALNAFSAAGTNRVIVGGKITNQQALTAEQSYTTTFDINVVYQ
ncbi:MAG: hypothetical protein HWE10_03485 [Gammaproteobacteria bacterium]|nr:hypothetical protein [Gammaproteobacteria bacterium]